MLFALLIPDAHAFAFHDDPRIRRFEGFMLNQVVPDMRLVGLHHMTDIIVFKRAVHDVTFL